ncbi:hypothetical protein BGW80DRAFT_1537215 [Lactifluus volemus]|nr:hypothetical protein BGW80DRAFT_1537215 [Lactifluus volemus]
MSDSFADLWNSSVPVKPSQPTPKLGTSPAPSLGAPRPKYDAFAMLAASGSNSSRPHSRTSSTSANPAQRSNGSAASTTSGDAFSDLISGSFGNNPSNAKLSMAERARAKTQVAPPQPTIAPPHSTSTWAGLDSLAGGTSFSSAPPSRPAPSQVEDDWLFGSSTSSAQPSPPKPQLDDWDFVSTKPSNEAQPEHSSQGRSLWDLDEFKSSYEQDQALLPLRTIRHLPVPIPLETLILVTVKMPCLAMTRRAMMIYWGISVDLYTSDQRDAPHHHTSSPPPHLVGQIVEMGFSPNEAQEALASTESGLDVQAALETLLSKASRSSPLTAGQGTSAGSQRELDHAHESNGWGDDQQTLDPPLRHSRHRTHPSQERPPPSSSETNYQQHTDKIIAQASEIGSHLFQRANAFWKEGKTRVQKVYEERAASSRTGTTGYSEGQNGKPRWMQENLDQNEVTPSEEYSRSSFRDEESQAPSIPAKPVAQTEPRPRAKPPPSQAQTPDLFGEDSPIAYVSPFRRGAGSRAPPSSSSTPAQPVPRRAPSPVRLAERQVISASPSAISASAQYKASGTEMFKLGRFAEAEAAYTSAILQLPDSHLLLVPLLNNRGLSRLKTGNMSGVIEDCTTVIAIVGPSYHPAREAKITREEDGARVELGDALIKAWHRRAEAYEGKEKWDLARQDWESIAGTDFAESIVAKPKMLDINNGTLNGGGSTPPVSRAHNPPRPTRRPPPRNTGGLTTPPSEAVARLKQANQDAEAEEQARIELKDSVDSRLSAWKNGKETNLRALVASLDTVLWPELGWQKVGMAELVTPNQVKIRYTKAIAKLHPDKLNVKNTTLEQRMIANGVFGTLNEAWNAFKP